MYVGNVNQSITHPHGVNAFGSCLLRVTPDLVSVRFAVNRVAKHPREAFDLARTAARDVRAAVRTIGVSDGDVVASETSLSEAFTGDYNDRKKVGYEGTVEFHVLLRDLEKLEPLLAGVVDAGADRILGVNAKTTRLRELRVEARRRAVALARAKAEELVAAAGSKLGAVLHIEDVSPDSLQRRGHAPDVDLTESDEEADPPSAHDPGSLVIAAVVMVCFAIV